jgi:protein-tyrosine phosphatase
MAETIFNKLCTIENTYAISAGLSIVRSSRTSKNSAILVQENFGVDISQREAVQLTEEMLKSADLVLTMTAYMRQQLVVSFRVMENKIYSLNEYVGISGDISDPYGGDMAIYSKTFNQLKNCILLLLDKLKEDKGTF